jgi:hypothetical protein
MELYLDVDGPPDTETRRFPLIMGRTWMVGRYTHRGGPLVEGRYLYTQGPLLDVEEYIPLENDWTIKRVHIQVGRDGTGPWVEDNGGGTLLNDMPLDSGRRPLCPDDQLRIRRWVLRVVGTARIDPAWLSWSGGQVSRLAGAIREGKDCSALPILADALEEAGCTEVVILEHLRSPGPHGGRCWVVDLLLGRD